MTDNSLYILITDITVGHFAKVYMTANIINYMCVDQIQQLHKLF